jgi:CheY-like chemotaxis protein
LRPNNVVFKPTTGIVLARSLCDALEGKTPQATRRAIAASVGSLFAGARILLVEDNPVNQLVARRILQSFAVEVTVANNGRDALAQIAGACFDLVLMDCHMPIMDGFVTTRAIREEERRSGAATRLPIIALTANVMSEDRELCRASGMDAHIGKPIDSAQLRRCLEMFLVDIGKGGGVRDAAAGF